MITLHDLDTAIAHCQGESNPNAETCKQLAAFYTIKQAMFGSGPAGDHQAGEGHRGEREGPSTDRIGHRPGGGSRGF